MRTIHYGKHVVVATNKRFWNSEILPDLRGKFNYLSHCFGYPIYRNETREKVLASCTEFAQNKTNLPVDFRTKNHGGTIQIDWSVQSTIMLLLGNKARNTIEGIGYVKICQDESFWAEDNPLGLPTYGEVLTVMQKYDAIMSSIESTIINRTINPMKDRQEWLRIKRDNSGTFSYSHGTRNLWMALIPEGMIPNGKTRIRIGD